MKTSLLPPRDDRTRSGLFVALVIAFLSHLFLLLLLVPWLRLPDPEPAPPMEIALVSPDEAPEPEPPSPLTPPEPEPAPPSPKAAPRPAPIAVESTAEPFGLPRHDLAPEPLQTAPEPEPSLPEKLDLALDWNRFEEVFGDVAVRERDEYHARSQERRRGGLAAGTLTGKVRRALENNRSWVAVGEQEPLGSRQKPFTTYLELVHDRFHGLFADDFLGSLSSLDPSDPLNDLSRSALMEFEILKGGGVNEIRVIRSSGNTVFDAAAVDSLYRGAPYPAPPSSILSWNERVYFRWGFFRNSRKCGVFNAEPFILRAPGSAPAPVAPPELIVDDG
ncbi:MAG TPA: TonB family protein [Polyangia bacterium]|nr:TonB family protein [Polyangia bacterium]